MVLSPRRLSDGEDGVVIAQFLVTKITFFSAEPRILTVSSSHLAVYNPRGFQCTNEWFLGDITDIQVPVDPDQFILVTESSRFRATRVRFQCVARSHLLALVYKLRRHFTLQPIRLNDFGADGRRQQYQCTEHFGDGSYDHFLLQVGVSGVSLVDEHGRKVAQFLFVNLQRIAQSTAHPDGLVLSTLFQERLFLVHPRGECIDHIRTAAQALGIHLPVDKSPLNMQLLRLRNTQALDQPAVVCFEVDKAVDDGKLTQPMQLIFQGSAILEVHRKLRTVITRPYHSLLCVVRSDWDSDTVVLQFLHRDNLVVRVEARDQFIALLLLVCREAGNHHVELAPSPIPTSRLVHPHVAENVRQSAAPTLEMFLLRRIVHAATGSDGSMAPEMLWPRLLPAATAKPAATRLRTRGRLLQHRRRGVMRTNAVMREAQLQSLATGASINDHMTLSIVMEEFNANLPLGAGLCDVALRPLLDRAMASLVDHLVTLTATLRSFVDATSSDVVITLQSLARLALSPHTFVHEEQVPALLDALYELLQRQHFLTCYWVLKLLQSYFEPRKRADARRHRAKALEHFVENDRLLDAVLALIPTASSLSAGSSGRWMRSAGGGGDSHSSDAFLRPNLDETLLFTNEARVEKDMNILTYEALFTLHHVLIYLQHKETQESELALLAVATAKPKDWTETIELDEREGDVNVHQRHVASAVAAKRAIGDRLLVKHRFLMDAVVDVRLQRACQTIVALITFLVHALVASTDQGDEEREEEEQEEDENVYRVGSDRDNDSRIFHRSEPLRRSSLDGGDGDGDGDEARRRRQLDELHAFLECYQADVATLDDRSRLFHEQPTILLPLLTFSRGTASEANGDSVFRLSDATPAKKKKEEDWMTIDQLVAEDRRSSISAVLRPSELLAPASRPRRPATHTPVAEDRPRLRVIQEKQPPPVTSSYSISDHSSSLKTSDSTPSSSFQPTFMRGSNFRRLDDARSEAKPSKPRPASAHGVDHTSLDQQPRPRPISATAIDRRLTAHVCDACIACNDVCGEDNCFFCAEKEFQLRQAFAGNNSLVASAASSTSGERRTYSTCEVRRHQDKRSCWVMVAGAVYDVTDLLSSHPGGAAVLLAAAQRHEDCAELFFSRHPFAARRVLESFRLGEVYFCETRTLFLR